MNKQNVNILIADDDPDYLFQFSLLLSNEGFNVIQTSSQKEAEAYLETNKPDIAVFDLMMEQHDSGFILAYKTKKMYPNTPVIICTAVGSETGMSFDIDNNWIKADLYLEKGKATSILAEEVKNLLNK